jgi:catechol 2,3-dioxygenase-like lactoylglutathione lyase family enzyme
MLGSSKIVAFVLTADSKRARSFYEGVLGLRFVSEDPFALALEANGNMIRIGTFPGFKPSQLTTALGWETAQMEKLVSGLRERGVSFEIYPGRNQDALGIWTAPNGDKVAWFKDPDGNVLSISQHVGRS